MLIKNTSFRVMKHTTLLPSVYFPSTLVLTFSSWRVRRRCPASLSHLFGRRAASSFTIHPSMRMMKMQSKNRKKTEPTRTGDGARKKKFEITDGIEMWFLRFFSFPSLPFASLFSTSFHPLYTHGQRAGVRQRATTTWVSSECQWWTSQPLLRNRELSSHRTRDRVFTSSRPTLLKFYKWMIT